MNSTITSIGIYHPDKIIDNSFFTQTLNTSDQWIRERTGIEQRYYAKSDEYTSDLCVGAALNLAKNYNKDLTKVDYIIVATSTADQVMPSVASQVQNRLGIPSAGSIDVVTACSGFISGVILAKGLIAANTHHKVLVIGAEVMSKVLDFEDRTSCILFGDGAGAVIVEATEENHLFNTLTGTSGEYGKDLYIAHQNAPISGIEIVANGKLHQNGRVVYKWAVQTLTDSLHSLAAKNEMDVLDVDYFIPHSANYRMLEAVFGNMNISMEKCLDSVRKFGNTSAASIPLAWYMGIKEGRVQMDDKLMQIGFGAGFAYSGIVVNNQIPRVEGM